MSELKQCPHFEAVKCNGEEYCCGCEDMHEHLLKLNQENEESKKGHFANKNVDLNFQIVELKAEVESVKKELEVCRDANTKHKKKLKNVMIEGCKICSLPPVIKTCKDALEKSRRDILEYEKTMILIKSKPYLRNTANQLMEIILSDNEKATDQIKAVLPEDGEVKE